MDFTRFRSALLSVGIVIGGLLCVPAALATTGCNAIGWDIKHQDVHGCDLYYPAIQWMYDEGIAEGEFHEKTSAGDTRLFHPHRPINRAEFTKLVLLGAGNHTAPAPCKENPFPDVLKDAWYAPYICEAKKRGIISGFPDGTFRPAWDINYANGSKILVKSFGIKTRTSDITAIDGEEIWYKPYVLALLREKAVAPTIATFDHRITRGEMAEMIYRLANHKPSYVMPNQETDGAPLGMGYTYPYSLELSMGLWVDAPDPPYFFTPSQTTLWGNLPSRVDGYTFFHSLQELRCSESGLWEHCKPVFVDWSIGLYVTGASVETARKYLLEWGEQETLYFGGKAGKCSVMGVEGENTQICFVPLSKNRTLIIERAFIDTNVVYMDYPGITPLKTSNAWFARIRKSMQFSE